MQAHVNYNVRRFVHAQNYVELHTALVHISASGSI